MTDAATPEWAELLQQAVTAQLFEVHTSMPGQIVTVYVDPKSKGQFVDVRPCLRRALPADDDNPQPFVEEDLPILPRVPVGYPQGGGFFISFPLKKGDFVTLIFAERSIDRWLATARKLAGTAISTGDIGTHTLDGAIALPVGPAPIAELLDGVDENDLVLGHVSGTPLLKMSSSGTCTLTGDLVVSGEVTAMAASPATSVTLSQHKHLTAMGPSNSPTPGT